MKNKGDIYKTLFRFMPLFILLLSLGGCGGCGGPDGRMQQEQIGRTELRESPMLTELVKQGKLPPLEQRLPENPVVERSFGEAARYGGTLRLITSGYWEYGGIDTVYGCRLVRAIPARDEDGGIVSTINDQGRKEVVYDIVGNLVEDWEYSDDHRVVTMRLRRGIRYSDGHPLTTEDIAYRWALWNDNRRYAEISPSPVQHIQGEPIRLEVIDDYEFRFLLPVPDPRWVDVSAVYLQFWEAPKHWIGQWDPNLNPDIKDWTEFKRRLGDWLDLSRPVLGPWRIVSWDSATKLVAERNPFFYIVDQDGRQLPYIDRLEGIAAGNADIAAMKVVDGQVDLYDNGRLQDLPLFKRHEQRGRYRVELLGEGEGSLPGLMINYFSDRDNLSEYIGKRDFRIALSLAINREEINQLVFNGYGLPTNCSFGDWHREQNATFDPQRAAALLDGLGLKDSTGNGMRNYPDGKELTVVVTTLPDQYAAVCELVTAHWRAAGINAILNNVDGSAYAEIRRQRRYDFLSAHDGYYRFSRDFNVRNWSPLHQNILLDRPEGRGEWEPFIRWIKSGGRQGRRPPQDLQQALLEIERIFNSEYSRAVKDEEVETAARQISRIWAENIFRIGMVGRAPKPVITSNRLHNVPEIVEMQPGGHWIRAGFYTYQLVVPD